MYPENSINHASGLPAIDNEALQVLIGTRLSDFVIAQYRRTLPLQLFLTIEMDVDLCSTITYLCEDHSDLPNMSDSALDGPIKRKVMSAPKVVVFSGFCKGGFETKLSTEQLECINQSSILRDWYNRSLSTAIEDGRNAIMARFYRHMLTNAHPSNTGNNAGLTGGGNVVGSPTNPVLFDPTNADKFFVSVLNVIKQMPRTNAPENEFVASADNAFIFGPQNMEGVLMQNDNYNSWNIVGDCANCGLFKDTFDRMPRGIMPITSFCVEKRVFDNSGDPKTVYPVLFGKRYMGTKANIRVQTYNYMAENKESIFYRTNYYWHIHTFDPRFLGVAWITVQNDQPATISVVA